MHKCNIEARIEAQIARPPVAAFYQRRHSCCVTTQMPSSRFVTAWAATQSQMFLVRYISHVTRLNHTAAASSSEGCIIIGMAVPMTAAVRVSVPKGTVHQVSLTAKRIRKPRRKNSSMIGTIRARPRKRIARNV